MAAGLRHCVGHPGVTSGAPTFVAVGLQFFVGRFVASSVGAPFMTPGAGTAHVVGRVACRWMRAGRRLNVVFRGCFVASSMGAPFMTPGAGTAHVVGRVACRWMRAGRWLVCRFVAVGLWFFVGRFAALRRPSGRHKWRPYVCGRLIVVSRRSSGRRKWRPYVCGWLIVVLRVVIWASRVAPLRLRVVDCCFAGGCWRRNEGLSGKGDGYEKKKPD